MVLVVHTIPQHKCKVCGCTRSARCEKHQGQNCKWVSRNLCSGCMPKHEEQEKIAA